MIVTVRWSYILYVIIKIPCISVICSQIKWLYDPMIFNKKGDYFCNVIFNIAGTFKCDGH